MSEFDDRFEAKRRGVRFDVTETEVKVDPQASEAFRDAPFFSTSERLPKWWNMSGPFSNRVGNLGPNGKQAITVEGEDVTNRRLAK